MSAENPFEPGAGNDDQFDKKMRAIDRLVDELLEIEERGLEFNSKYHRALSQAVRYSDQARSIEQKITPTDPNYDFKMSHVEGVRSYAAQRQEMAEMLRRYTAELDEGYIELKEKIDRLIKKL